jgi:hypothetical protein
MQGILHRLICVVAIVAMTGCASSSRKHSGDQITFCPHPSADPAQAYSAERLATDYRRLTTLASELNDVDLALAKLIETVRFADIDYLTDEDNRQAQFLIMRVTHARGALIDMLDYYRIAPPHPDLDLRAKGAVLGMSAGLHASYASSRIVALLLKEKKIRARFNTEHPRFDIPAGGYDRLSYDITSHDQIESLHVGWHLFSQAMADPTTPLSQLYGSDPAYAALIRTLYRLHTDTQLQTDYVLHGGHHALPSLSNRLRHSSLAALADQAKHITAKEAYEGRGFIFKNVARIKNPLIKVVTFSPEQVKQIKTLLQPGDIILTYTAGYMSDVFLPGEFKHGITYIGSVEQRRQVGLTDDYLAQHAVSESQRKKLLAHVKLTQTPEGDPVDVIEAVSEGVVMHSLAQLLKTHINRMVVLRPTFTDEERLQQLFAVFQYVGATYDFKFDFTDDAYQCCTEVVYRTTNGKGDVNFSLFRKNGLWVLMADDIVNHHIENPTAFDFVLLAEEAPDAKGHAAQILTGKDGAMALEQIMSKE